MHVHPAAFHPLTPGSPAYALLKLTAVGSVFGLKAFLSRRSRRDQGEAAGQDPAADRPRQSHPVSARKARRRRKRRP